MSGSLSIVFTGLCALVGNGDGQPADVLLLDAPKVGEVRGVTLPAHAPTLVVSLSDLANPDTSGPTRVVVGRTGSTGRAEQLGLWDLAGSEVRIRLQGGTDTGVRLFRPGDGETSWPEPPLDVNDPVAWRDIRFVADMAALVEDGRIDPRFLGDGGKKEQALPPSVAARIHLESGVLEGAIPSQPIYRDDRFEFRSGISRRTVRQALTDTAQWTLRTGEAPVAIDITPAEGGPTKRLLLTPGAEPQRLYVSNLPTKNSESEEAHHEMDDDEVAALHFSAYYSLLLKEPSDRPLPRLWSSATADMGTGMIRPFFCPPALFARP